MTPSVVPRYDQRLLFFNHTIHLVVFRTGMLEDMLQQWHSIPCTDWPLNALPFPLALISDLTRDLISCTHCVYGIDSLRPKCC